LCADLRLRWGLKQSCSPRWKLSNGMSSKFQLFSNDIKNYSRKWVLTPAIALWRFESPFGTLTPNMEFTRECDGSFPHTLWHSREHVMWLPGLSLDLQPCNPLP
jgi:hypothetical protein